MPVEANDKQQMRRAIELAYRGQGQVEPNPMVGCVIAIGDDVLGEGWHQKFGGNHAEIEALNSVPANRRGELKEATLYVTLEPCSHFGKTPPCADAILASPIRRVVVGREDPFAEVSGRGLKRLRDQGLEVVVGVEDNHAAALTAPFEMLVREQRPWVIAKWAMTLDGKIASHTGNSQWISSDLSRQMVHQLRGRVDAVVVGSGTVAADDPMLTARPAGDRLATRVVFDSGALLPSESKLAQSAKDVPVLIFASSIAETSNCDRLTDLGCEVVVLKSAEGNPIHQALKEMGKRQMTNILVEGGSKLLGSFFAEDQIDEVYAFIAPKIVGGDSAPSPVGGIGRSTIGESVQLRHVHNPSQPPQQQIVGGDVFVHGRVLR